MIHAQLTIDEDDVFEVFSSTPEAAEEYLREAVLHTFQHASNCRQLWEAWKSKIIYRKVSMLKVYRNGREVFQ